MASGNSSDEKVVKFTKPKSSPGGWDDLNSSDEWDYEVYHISATNKHDHSAVYNFPRTWRLPQEMLSQIGFHISDANTPYKRVADYVRDAVTHRLAYQAVRDDLGEFKNANNLMALRDNIEADMAAEAEMKETINIIGNRVKSLTEQGNASAVVELIESARRSQLEDKYQDEWNKMLDMIEVDVERFEERNRRGL